jgi:hypothetical protein
MFMAEAGFQQQPLPAMRSYGYSSDTFAEGLIKEFD